MDVSVLLCPKALSSSSHLSAPIHLTGDRLCWCFLFSSGIVSVIGSSNSDEESDLTEALDDDAVLKQVPLPEGKE
eukprot:scaffold12086_cov66-Cyclotella_meneghiniana.AAC.1